MPSIFVWKANQPQQSNLHKIQTISYYSGANWFLEEHPTCSRSAVYLSQCALSQEGWMFDIKWMPTNWVGSHLLESKSLPYTLIKEDTYGRLEQLGDWMRATTKHDVSSKEWEYIQQWSKSMKDTSNKEMKYNNQSHSIYKDVPCLINLSINSYTNTGQNHQTQNLHNTDHQRKKMIST